MKFNKSIGIEMGSSGAVWLILLGLLSACSDSKAGLGHADAEHAEEDGHREDSDHDEHPEEEDHDDHAEEEGHDDHADEEGHVEGRVELTAQQLAAVDIQVVRIASGTLAESLVLPAVVTMNSDTSTHVNPKVPGLVRSITKKLGEHVLTGDLLCTIDSVELGNAAAGLVLAEALVQTAEETLLKETDLFDHRLKTTAEVLSGAVAVNESIYQREVELQAKAVSTIRPLLEAEKVLKTSKLIKSQRLTDLAFEKAARLLALEVLLREKRVLAASAKNRLLAMGVRSDAMDAIGGNSTLLSGTYDIIAVRPGIVSERHITTGEYVDAETRLFTIEDLSSVWVIASAFEQQLTQVRTGQEALVSLNSFPGLTFDANVSVVGYQADAESRAIGVRFELENREIEVWPEAYPIRPGMFGSVSLVTGGRQVEVVLPEKALVHDDQGDSVFVRISERVFEQRRVHVAQGTGEWVEVLSGLEAGEQVALTGTFLLKSVAGQEKLGGGHSH